MSVHDTRAEWNFFNFKNIFVPHEISLDMFVSHKNITKLFLTSFWFSHCCNRTSRNLQILDRKRQNLKIVNRTFLSWIKCFDPSLTTTVRMVCYISQYTFSRFKPYEKRVSWLQNNSKCCILSFMWEHMQCKNGISRIYQVTRHMQCKCWNLRFL